MPQRELIVRAIITQSNAVLVNQTTHPKTNQTYYALPGGHVEAGEDCKQALQRELKEELGVSGNVGELCFVIENIYPGRRMDDIARHELTLYFQVTLKSPLREDNGLVRSPESSKNFRWLPCAQIEESPLLPEVTQEFLSKYFSNQPTPLYAFQDSTSQHAE